MTDILARQRQIVGTTAQWTTDDLILGAGELALERLSDGSVKARVGDGAAAFSDSPYLGGGGSGAGFFGDVTNFGATGDGVTDDTAAVVAAINAVYALGTGSGWKDGLPLIYFPYGKYRIASPNALFAGCSGGNFKVVGDGKDGGTQIIYDVPAATATDYLIKNDNLFGFCQFHGIEFICENVAANQNFMQQNSTGFAQNMSFTECTFTNFSDIFKFTGTANASENTFFNCKFTGFSGKAFYFNNTQSVNNRFFGCDIEVFTGIAFYFDRGNNVSFYQGSIIPVGAVTAIIKVSSIADYNSFGPGNSPNLIFYGTRFEVRDGAILIDKEEPSAPFHAVFNGCGMGGQNIAGATKAIDWAGAGFLTFRDCRNCDNYLINNTVNGSASVQEWVVTIDNCDFDNRFLADSIFAITGITTSVGNKPLFKISNCGSALDGEFRAGASQYSVSAVAGNRAISQSRHAFSFYPDERTVFFGASGSVVNLPLPPVIVSRMEFYPIAIGAGTTGTIVLKNVAGTTLATIGWDMATPVNAYEKIDFTPYFVNTPGGDYLTLTFANAAALSLFVKGTLYLTY